MSRLFWVCAAAYLAACTSMSEVTPIGHNAYLVGVSVRGGLTSDAEVKAKALNSANSFCAGLGKSMTLVSSKSSGTQGWTPQNAEITFRCDPAP